MMRPDVVPPRLRCHLHMRDGEIIEGRLSLDFPGEGLIRLLNIPLKCIGGIRLRDRNKKEGCEDGKKKRLIKCFCHGESTFCFHKAIKPLKGRRYTGCFLRHNTLGDAHLYVSHRPCRGEQCEVPDSGPIVSETVLR